MNTLEITSAPALTQPAKRNPKTLTVAYWVATLLFAALMLADGIAGLSQVEDGKKAMTMLGYPFYIMTILGAAKVLGAVALVQTRFVTLKEWAYAGFAISFVGASASWGLSGHGPELYLFPLIALAMLLGTYALWKKWSR